jgi:hypothetical protein
MADRGEARAEVIHQPANTQLGKTTNGVFDTAQLEQGGFGDLQVQAVGAHCGLLEPLPNLLYQAGPGQNFGTEVGGHAQGRWQVCERCDALAQYLQINLLRHLATAGNRQERVGHLHAAIGTRPARQGLITPKGAVGEIHRGHEPGLQLPALQALAQFLQQPQALLGPRRQMGIGTFAAVPALGRRLAHRQ